MAVKTNPVDSLRCLAVIGSVLGRAGETGQNRRLEDAKKGIVAWETPLDVQRFMQLQRDIANNEAANEARHVNPDQRNAAFDQMAAEEKANGGQRGDF